MEPVRQPGVRAVVVDDEGREVHYLADVLPILARGVFTSAELAELTPAAWM
jgi:hypothetical protein